MTNNFVWNKETHTYEIAKESLVDVAKRNIAKYQELTNVVIQNDADYNRIKDARTELNKAVKDVADARKQMTAVALSLFAPQCKEIEKLGAQVAGQLTVMINEYKGVTKDTTYKITVSSLDKKAIEKVKEFALKFGCEVKEAGEKKEGNE